MVRLRVQRALHWTRLSCKRSVSNQVRLGLASLFFAVNPAVAQNDAKVTARDVVDRASLKAFVLEAREYLDSFETLSGYRDALESFRAGGDWKQGLAFYKQRVD